MYKVDIYKVNDWLVNQYEVLKIDNTNYFFDKFIPRTDVSIIFHFGDFPSIFQNVPIKLPFLFVAPVVPNALVLNVKGNLDTFVVSCKATVFSRFFHVDLSPTPCYGVNVSEKFFPLWIEMKSLSSIESRIRCFSNYIATIQKGTYSPDEIDILYQKILENSSSNTIKGNINNLSISERTLQRHFIQRTGVSPKKLMRIVRLNYLWSKVINENAIDSQDLVFEGKYFDQTHFIKDFKSIIGETPNYFFKRNLEAVKILSGYADSK